MAGFLAWPGRRSRYTLSAVALADRKILASSLTLSSSAPPGSPIGRPWKSQPCLPQSCWLRPPKQPRATSARRLYSCLFLVILPAHTGLVKGEYPLWTGFSFFPLFILNFPLRGGLSMPIHWADEVRTNQIPAAASLLF